MSFTDNWSDEEFIRQMKALIGNEGDIHVTCNHSEGEQVTETHVHAESSLVTQQTFGDALHLLSRFQKSEIHSTRLQSAFRYSKASSTNGIPSSLC